MTVNQIAQLANVSPHVVRYYSRIGLLSPRRNPANGYKTFSSYDVVRLRFIRLARSLGYALTDISAILASVHEGRPVGENMRAMLHRRLAENMEQIRMLAQQGVRMERALQRWGDAPEHSTHLGPLCGFLEILLGEEAPE
jgi:DNA-binding transcriptional MerR regulator